MGLHTCLFFSLQNLELFRRQPFRNGPELPLTLSFRKDQMSEATTRTEAMASLFNRRRPRLRKERRLEASWNLS